MKKIRKIGVRLKHLGRQAKEGVKNNGKMHFVDCTSLLFSTYPIAIAFEVNAGKILEHIPYLGDNSMDLSDDLSVKAKLTISVWTYLGLGSVYSRGRQLSRRLFNITRESNEMTQAIHDTLYPAAFNSFVGPALYFTSGARDLREIVSGATVLIGLGIGTGWLMGYAIDAGRDLAGLENCERSTYPDILRRQNKLTKRAIGAGLVGASIGLCSLIYSATESKFGQDYRAPIAQQVSEINDVVN